MNAPGCGAPVVQFERYFNKGAVGASLSITSTEVRWPSACIDPGESSRYGGFFGGLLYSKWYDLDPATPDLDIDIKDLQKVFGPRRQHLPAPQPRPAAPRPARPLRQLVGARPDTPGRGAACCARVPQANVSPARRGSGAACCARRTPQPSLIQHGRSVITIVHLCQSVDRC